MILGCVHVQLLKISWMAEHRNCSAEYITPPFNPPLPELNYNVASRKKKEEKKAFFETQLKVKQQNQRKLKYIDSQRMF